MRFIAAGLLSIAFNTCSVPFVPPEQTPSAINECTGSPVNTLTEKYVEEIEFDGKPFITSGHANIGNQKGFTFLAEAGDRLKYNTEDNICIWVYTPQGDLLDNKKLPVSGKYTVQVSSLTGSTSFELKLDLQKDQQSDRLNNAVSALSQNKNNSVNITNITSQEHSFSDSPTKFVEDYYNGINQRKYEATWNSLSSDFKEISDSFSGYIDWWDSVKTVEINSTKLVSKTDLKAVVDAELAYILKTGIVESDKRGRIHLIWDQNLKTWKIDKKTLNTASNQANSAEFFISSYYSKLNDREYSETWEMLSSEFQRSISGGFSDYSSWWDTVDRSKVNSIKLISQSSNQAILDVEIQYIFKTGNIQGDPKRRFYLSRNSKTDRWQISKKIAP